MAGKPHTLRRTYTAEEKESTLLQLALNAGNIRRTAKETGIPKTTVERWKNEDLKAFMELQKLQTQKFFEDAWRNIHELNKPELIRDLIVKAKAKGELKQIVSSIAILLDKMAALTRAQNIANQLPDEKEKEKQSSALDPESKDFAPTEEDLAQLIREEEAKQRKHRKT